MDEIRLRSKRDREPMSDARLHMLLNYAVGTLAMVMGFAALYMVIYFMGT